MRADRGAASGSREESTTAPSPRSQADSSLQAADTASEYCRSTTRIVRPASSFLPKQSSGKSLLLIASTMLLTQLRHKSMHCTSLFPVNEITEVELRVPSADPRYGWNPVGPVLSLRNERCLRPSGLGKRYPGLPRLGRWCPGPTRLGKGCPGLPRLGKRCPGPPRTGKRCLWAGEGGVH